MAGIFPTPNISVVTPTLGRPAEVQGLLENLDAQRTLPMELILVDGSTGDEASAEESLSQAGQRVSFPIRFIRRAGGTAVQRNAGLDVASGEFLALVDDDIRLDPDFLERAIEVLRDDHNSDVGGVTGYITNQHLDPESSPRWRLYRRLKLFTTYEPGRYDYHVGYPINRYLQPPHDGIREIDFMGAGCAVWRAEVFREGLRFDEFFSGFGVLEDAHLALRARRKWRLLEVGGAQCVHLKAESSREGRFSIGRKSAINYRYVFVDIVPKRTVAQEARFWSVQLVDLASALAGCFRGGGRRSLAFAAGKLAGVFQATLVRAKKPTAGLPDA